MNVFKVVGLIEVTDKLLGVVLGNLKMVKFNFMLNQMKIGFILYQKIIIYDTHSFFEIDVHMTKYYEVRDPIYGFISFNDLERDVIKDASFQRLRRISQLGLTYMAYPSATHTRFEHSLGVMHLSTRMFDSLMKKDSVKQLIYQNYGQINPYEFEKTRQMIRIAAILHDIGHAPFSHAAEEVMPKKDSVDHYSHEDYSVHIIQHVFESVLQKSKHNTFGITAAEVAALIEGNPVILDDRVLWKVLIKSQLDADRGDYLLRDSHHVGVKYGIYDHHRFINCINLGKNPDKDFLDLCVQRDGWLTAEALLIARYKMFSQVCFHKTRRAYDYHLCKAMEHVLPHGILPKPDVIDDYLSYDDAELYHLFKKESDKNEDCNAILNRNHIRCAYECVNNFDDVEIINDITEKLTNEGIWFYIDKSDQQWYKEPSSNDILIIDSDDDVYPLNHYSKIFRELQNTEFTYVFVKKKDKSRVKDIIDTINKKWKDGLGCTKEKEALKWGS